MGSDGAAPAFADPDVALVRDAAVAAGRIAADHFARGVRTWTKGDASPVTEADLAVDRFLRETLLAARPDYGWLSEESPDDPARLDRPRTFVIDPIDGTKAFIKREDRWVVSVAVVAGGRPVAGCLVRPVTGEVFLAAAGAGAFHDGVRLSVGGPRETAGARVSGPKRLDRHPDAVPDGMVLVPYVPSLALRLAMVATGALDAMVARGGSSDWDLAAADLVVSEAGGRLETVAGRGLAYNGASTDQPAILACRPGLEAVARGIADRLGYGTGP